MSVTIYRSSDASAPVLNGQAGSLVAVLDACLVNGYGSQPAAGWTIAFTGTNKRDYRQASSGFYLDVDDSAAQTAAGKEANLRGYEAMTALQTGTNPFPTTGQLASPGPQVRKSATADAIARGWIVAADGRTVHMLILTGDSAGVYYGFSFGDFYSLKASDAYKCVLMARNSANGNAADAMDVEDSNWNTSSHTIYVARPLSGTAGAIQIAKSAIGSSIPSGLGTTTAYLTDGNIYVAPYYIGGQNEDSGNMRGRIRGLWRIITHAANDGDIFTGNGDLSGRTFLVISKGTNSGIMALETSNTWDTSS